MPVPDVSATSVCSRAPVADFLFSSLLFSPVLSVPEFILLQPHIGTRVHSTSAQVSCCVYSRPIYQTGNYPWPACAAGPAHHDVDVPVCRLYCTHVVALLCIHSCHAGPTAACSRQRLLVSEMQCSPCFRHMCNKYIDMSARKQRQIRALV